MPCIAKLFFKLQQEHGDWRKAIGYYHSAKSEYNRKYSRKVLISWLGN
jgi:hypothetical protein